MKNLDTQFAKEIALIILVNILLADLNLLIYPIIWLSMFLIAINEILYILIIPFLVLLFIFKWICLPMLYSYFEKNAKSKYTISLIINLKNNNFSKLIILVLSCLPALLMCIPKCLTKAYFNNVVCPQNIINDFYNTMLIKVLLLGLFSSYLVLFGYWWLKNAFIKYIQNELKN